MYSTKNYSLTNNSLTNSFNQTFNSGFYEKFYEKKTRELAKQRALVDFYSYMEQTLDTKTIKDASHNLCESLTNAQIAENAKLTNAQIAENAKFNKEKTRAENDAYMLKNYEAFFRSLNPSMTTNRIIM
jgi:hypothetical protein